MNTIQLIRNEREPTEILLWNKEKQNGLLLTEVEMRQLGMMMMDIANNPELTNLSMEVRDKIERWVKK